MLWYFAMVFGASLIGVALGVGWWAFRRPRRILAGSVAATTGIAGVLAVGVDLATRVVGAGPVMLMLPPPPATAVWLFDYRYTLPLVAGCLGLALLAFPIRRREGSGSADLAPRSPATFAKAWWFVPPGTVLGIVLTVTIAAGSASEPDPVTGKYDMYTVDAGAMSVGTTIYGWHFSIPALVALAVLLLLALLDLILIARPPLLPDRAADTAIRSLRTRNVLVAVTGSLLLHLGMVCASLSATASVRGGMATPGGEMFLWSPMAALEPIFTAAITVATALGIALWTTLALPAVPARHSAQVKVTS
jgi:hypothetical protein